MCFFSLSSFVWAVRKVDGVVYIYIERGEFACWSLEGLRRLESKREVANLSF